MTLHAPSYAGGFASRERGQLQHQNAWRGVVGAWCPSLGATGSSLRDHSGLYHHGPLTGHTLSAAWADPHGLTFDGSNDYVPITNPARLVDLPTVTFAGWFKANGDYNSRQALMVAGAGWAANWGVTFGFTDSKIELWNSAAGPVISSTASISDDEWHHYVLTRTGVTGDWDLAIYLDGKPDNTGNSAVNPQSASDCSIGRFGGFNSYFLNGIADGFLVYDRRITADEVALLHSLGPGGMYQRRQPVFKAPAAGRINSLIGVGGGMIGYGGGMIGRGY